MRTGKTVLLVTLVAVVALVGVLVKDRFIERWFLEQLYSKDAAVRNKAAAKLASLGAVNAIPTLLALIRCETTFDTKTVLRPIEANVPGAARPFSTAPVRVTPGGVPIGPLGRRPGSRQPTPNAKDAAATFSHSHARQNYTVVPHANGPWTMTYGSDIFCFEAPELCLHLIDLVYAAGAVPHLRRAFDNDDLHIRHLAATMISVLRERAQGVYPLLREIVLDEEEVVDMNRPDYRTEASEAIALGVGDNVEHLVPMFIDMILA